MSVTAEHRESSGCPASPGNVGIPHSPAPTVTMGKSWMGRTTGTMESNPTQCREMQRETPCSGGAEAPEHEGDVTPRGKGGARPAMPANPGDTSPQHSPPQPVLEPSMLRHGQDRQDRHRQVLQIQSRHRNCKNDSQGPTTETGRRFQASRGFLGVPPRHSGDKGNQKSPCSCLLPPA